MEPSAYDFPPFTRVASTLSASFREPGTNMAGISVSLDGDRIELTFRKDDQATAVVMDAGAARMLINALSGILATLGESEGGEGENEEDSEILDVTSPSIDIGLDEAGRAVLSLQAGPLPPFLLRLNDDEARHIAESLLEILSSPGDVRTSQGRH